MLLVWAVSSRSMSVILGVSSSAATLVLLLMLHPQLLGRFRTSAPAADLGAEYRLDYNVLRHRPNATGTLSIRLKNVGAETWFTGGTQPVTMAYRWYELDHRTRVRPKTILTPLPRAIPPQESTTVDAAFVTPDRAGSYLLVWELNRREDGWFGRHGVVPAIMEAEIRDDAEPWFGSADLSRWYRREESGFFLSDLPVTRRDLWRAAWHMTLEHPFLGAGPDNFRLLYGKRMALAQTNTKVRANSLYLELLTGSGLVGLLGFVVMITAVPWKANAAIIGLGIFLVHGVVDDFLVTTPIYFAFWMLLALAAEAAPARVLNCAPPDLTPAIGRGRTKPDCRRGL